MEKQANYVQLGQQIADLLAGLPRNSVDAAMRVAQAVIDERYFTSLSNQEQSATNETVHNLSTWDDLIDLAEKNILWQRIKSEELQAAIGVYRKKRDAGLPFPGLATRD